MVSGNRIETPTYVVTVHGYTDERVAAPLEGLDIDEDAPPARWIYVNVEYECKDAKEIHFSDGFWRLVDSDGYRYEPPIAYHYLYRDRERPALESGDLARNERVRGWLAFKPRATATVDRVLVKTSVFGDTLAIPIAAIPEIEVDQLL